MSKKCAKVLCGSFRKENQGFREDGGKKKKITLSSQGFDWRHKVSIYKLKLGSELFNGVWTFPRVYGPANIKE